MKEDFDFGQLRIPLREQLVLRHLLPKALRIALVLENKKTVRSTSQQPKNENENEQGSGPVNSCSNAVMSSMSNEDPTSRSNMTFCRCWSRRCSANTIRR